MKRIYSHLISFFLCFILGQTYALADKHLLEAGFTEPYSGMEMVLIKGGTFVMGDNLGVGSSYDKPTRTVAVPDFYMGKYEVTFEQYALFASSTGDLIPNDSGWGFGSRPVINLTWERAVKFAEWLSEKSGKKFRLPSEAEWEYAARGGTTGEFWWGDKLGTNNANCLDCGSQWDGQMTAPVGSFPANPYGLHDMTGNVYEWCQDTYYRNYEDAPSDGSAVDFGDPTQHITRGGSWHRSGVEMRPFARCWDIADVGRSEIGFRLVMEK